MMLGPTLRVRREPLLRASQTLPPITVTILVHLVASACAHTHRVWTSAYRIGTALSLSSGIVDQALTTLGHHGLIQTTVLRSDLKAIEVRGLLAAEDEAPSNLPVEPL